MDNLTHFTNEAKYVILIVSKQVRRIPFGIVTFYYFIVFNGKAGDNL